MKQEEKKLLLKVLCEQLPYGPKVNIKYEDSKDSVDENLMAFHIGNISYNLEYRNMRPYLRPMSSMTYEESKEYELLANHCIVTSIGFIHFEAAPLVDWLNEHHFDYRGLIEKGLALEAPEGMYKEK